jgi:outer membrane murein-binding lipoprotein Lpp
MEMVNRRKFALVALTSAAAMVAGCDSEPKPDPVAMLLNNGNVHQAVQNIDDAIANLEGDVDDFDDDDWRDVVPNVKSSADEIREAFDQLKTALGYSDAS